MRGSIVGCARDCARFLPDALTSAVNLSRHFEECIFVFYENDSKDSTLELLDTFCANDPVNRRVISEKNVPGHRESRLAHGRKTAMKSALKSDPTVVVVMDMDDVNRKIENFSYALKLVVDGELDVATANQHIQYYDLWALRTGRELERCRHLPAAASCRLQRDFKLPEEFKWLSDLSFNLLRSVQKSNSYANVEYTEVVSAFGGVAVYDARTAAASVDAYAGTTADGFEVCEHVPLHEHIVKSGGKVGIVRSFTNTGWDDRISREVRIYGIVLLSLLLGIVLGAAVN